MFHDARQASTLTRPVSSTRLRLMPSRPEVILDIEVGDPGAADDQVVRGRSDSSADRRVSPIVGASSSCGRSRERRRRDAFGCRRRRSRSADQRQQRRSTSVKPSEIHLIAASARLGIGQDDQPCRAAGGARGGSAAGRRSWRGTSSVMSLERMRLGIEIVESRRGGSGRPGSRSGQPRIQAKTPTNRPTSADGQEHQVIAQPAGLDRRGSSRPAT